MRKPKSRTSQDLAPLIDDLEEHVVHPPPEPAPDEDGEISQTEQAAREAKIKSRTKREVKLQKNLTAMLNATLDQCRADALSRVDPSSRYDTMNRSEHAKGLVEVMNSHCCYSSSN